MRLFEDADPARAHRRDHGLEGATDAETPLLDLGPRGGPAGPPRWIIRAALGAAAAVLIVVALAVIARRDHNDTPPVTTAPPPPGLVVGAVPVWYDADGLHRGDVVEQTPVDLVQQRG